MQQTTFDVETSIKSAELQQAAAANKTAVTPHPNDVPIDFVKLAQQPQYQTNEQKMLGALMEIAANTRELLEITRKWATGAIWNEAQDAEPSPIPPVAAYTPQTAQSTAGKTQTKMFVGKPRR